MSTLSKDPKDAGRPTDAGVLKTRRRLLVNPASLSRLEAGIADVRGKLEVLRESHEGEAWVEACKGRLDQARACLEARNADAGFERLLGAFRELVPGMEPEQRSALAVSLQCETARKLRDSWRGKATAKLLAGKPEEIGTAALQEALWHRDTHAQNGYLKIGLHQRQLHVLGSGLAVLLLVVIAAAALGVFESLDDASPILLPSSIFLGLLGGTLSAALSVTRVEKDARIPDIQRSRWILFTRGVLGAAAALPIYLLIRGEMIAVPLVEEPAWPLLFFSFLAGFSERWFLSKMGEPEDRKEDKTDDGGSA